MAVRIYPNDECICGQVIKDGQVLTNFEFDYIQAHGSGEFGSIGISIDCDGNSIYKDSFVQMKLTIAEAESFIKSIQEEIKNAYEQNESSE